MGFDRFSRDAQNRSVGQPVYQVAIALVLRDGRWLVAERHADAHLGGLWEFPGGKFAPPETPEQAAVRELFEECGVRAEAGRVIHELAVGYADRQIRLYAVRCRWVAGEPRPLGNARCEWVTLAELRRLPMPAANAELIAALEVEESTTAQGVG